MSEQPKKARDIKDLKARLGRTGQASLPGPASGVPAPGVPAPFPGGPPGRGRSMPGPGIPRGSVPAPFGGTRPGASGRPPSDPFAPPPASVPPGSMRPSAGPGPGPVSADPFAAAPPGARVGGPQEVRLVIDDKAVSDAEVGRRSAGKFIAAAVVAALVGSVMGWFVGSTARERQLYDLVLQDAKDVYNTVNEASPVVEKAHKLINQALKAAAPGPGKDVEVDFKAIEELRSLEQPFSAGAFSRKHYRAFEPATVDALFGYYNNTNLLWSKIAAIAATTLPPGARKALTEAASAAGKLASTDYGCVPFQQDKFFACGLVTLASVEGQKVSVVARGGSYEKQLFGGQSLGKDASNFVIPVDKGRSAGILAAASSEFQTYARSLMETKKLADETVEVQGRLIQQLGNIAKLQSLN